MRSETSACPVLMTCARCKFVVKHNRALLVVLISLLPPVSSAAEPTAAPAYVVDHCRSPQARLRPLPLEAVEWTTGFWADRYRQLCEVTLEESWQLLADPAAGPRARQFPVRGQARFRPIRRHDLAGRVAVQVDRSRRVRLAVESRSALARRMDEAIALIAAAQQPDGYLSTMPLASQKPRFQNAQDHEVYNMGHLLTAGVIHHRMTGQDNLLNVARRAGDFLCANLGVTVKPYMAHNPSAIMGLVELYAPDRRREVSRLRPTHRGPARRGAETAIALGHAARH